jgi:translation initiation factor 1
VTGVFALPRHSISNRLESMKNRSSSGGLVYSTDSGRMCAACRQPIAQCACSAPGPAPVGDGIVRVSRETQGRKGKGVTVIRGLVLDAEALAKVGRELKAACGSGGTVKDGAIEIQGDHRDRIVLHLQGAGWTVKRAGG